jgi:hypothetical protein
MTTYTLTVETERPLGTMNRLLDGIEQVPIEEGFRDGEWHAEVHGPAELRIVMVDR